VIVGIMQPYLFPYIGYFQLIAHCDVFVLHDDVQYIAGGWINRNRILVNGAPAWVTLPVRSAPHTLPINQRRYDMASGQSARIVRRVEAAYRRAPFVSDTLPLVARVMAGQDPNVADFNARAIDEIKVHLGIRTPILRSSHMRGLDGLGGGRRVIAICKALEAKTYVNPIGGSSLYTPALFAEAGIDLRFLEVIPRSYGQFSPRFEPSLSIIDVMMHNDDAAMKEHLSAYRIVAPGHPSAPRVGSASA